MRSAVISVTAPRRHVMGDGDGLKCYTWKLCWKYGNPSYGTECSLERDTDEHFPISTKISTDSGQLHEVRTTLDRM